MLLWQVYFYRAGGTLPQAITGAREPVRQSVTASWSHLLMIAGVVLAGAGFELYITQPLVQPAPQWLIAILGGPALFLVGRATMQFQVFGRVFRSRLAGLLALCLLVPVTWYLPPLAAGAAAAAVLAGIAAVDVRRVRRRGPATLAPPT